MPSPRKPRNAAPAAKSPAAKSPPASQTPAAPAAPQPGFTRLAWGRLGLRSVIACLVVGCLTLVAGWHSAGLVRRGEIDRMVRMSAGAPRPAEAEPKTRGKLDRNRLNALVATAGK